MNAATDCSCTRPGRQRRRGCRPARAVLAALGSALGALAAVLAVVPAAAADPGVTPQQILIGQSVTLQGGSNRYGEDVLAGVQVLFDQVNRDGGVNGRRIVLRTLDDDNRTATAEANARQLVQEGAFIVFGSIEGGPSTAVMKVTQAARVPFFGPMAGSPTLRRPHQDLVFPVRAEHREEFRTLVRYATDIGLRRVAFLHADNEVGQQHLANVKLAAAEFGATFVLAMPIGGEPGDVQLDGFVRQLREQAVDFVINHGSAALYEKLIRRARGAGLRTTFLAVNSGSTQLAAALGPLAKGMVFAQVLPNPDSAKHAITREYQQAFKAAHPGRAFSYGSLEGYLTAKALVLALQQTGPELTRAALVRRLESLDLDLGGLRLRWRPGDHTGSVFVDLAMVTREGRFLQ